MFQFIKTFDRKYLNKLRLFDKKKKKIEYVICLGKNKNSHEY